MSKCIWTYEVHPEQVRFRPRQMRFRSEHVRYMHEQVRYRLEQARYINKHIITMGQQQLTFECCYRTGRA